MKLKEKWEAKFDYNTSCLSMVGIEIWVLIKIWNFKTK